MGISKILMFVCAFAYSVASAADRPSIDFWKKQPYAYEEKQDDKSVMIDVEPIFKARRENEECRKAYLELEKKFLEAEARFEKLKKEGADLEKLKAASSEADAARDRYLKKMQLGEDSCGDCITPEVTVLKVDEGLVPETWYESHGFCTLEGLKEQAIESGYKQATEFLRTPRRYLKRDGGFRAILEFLAFDGKTGEALPEFGPAEDGEFHGYMAVRATIPIFGFVSFSYFIKNLISSKETESSKYFDLTFEQTDKSTKLVKEPELYDLGLDGARNKPKVTWKLPRILGWWYVDTEKGLFRYSTAAQFPVNLDAAKHEARRTHLDTIATLRAKFFTTSPDNR